MYVLIFVFICLISFAGCGEVISLPFSTSTSTSTSTSYLVSPSPLHGFHGIYVSHDDKYVYAGSVAAQRIIKIAIDGPPHTAEIIIDSPHGESDDIVETVDGKLYYTAILGSQLRVWNPVSGEVEVLVDNMPGANPLIIDKRGRLFAGQCFFGDALWELDPVNKISLPDESQVGTSSLPRLIRKDLGTFNAFDFDPKNSDRLCGPVWFKSEIACIDINTGEMEVILHLPGALFSAVNFDITGRMFAADIGNGNIHLVDLTTHTSRIVIRTTPGIDNFASAHTTNTLYWSNCDTASLYAFDTNTYAVTTIHQGFLSGVSGLDLVDGVLYVADTFGVKSVDLSGNREERERVELYSYSEPLNFLNPAAVAVNRERKELIISSFISGHVVIFGIESDGKYTKLTEMSMKTPLDIEILNSNGDFLVAEQGTGSLLLVHRDTLHSTPIATNLISPTCIALNSDKTIAYVTESNGVTRVDIASRQQTRILDASRPVGIAVSEFGSLYLVEADARKVTEFVLTDGGIAGRTIQKEIEVDGPSLLLSDIVVDVERGQLYVSGTKRNAILKIPIPVSPMGGERGVRVDL